MSERLRLLLERAQSGYRLRDAATGEVVRWEDPRILVIPVAGVSFRPESLEDDPSSPGIGSRSCPSPTTSTTRTQSRSGTRSGRSRSATSRARSRRSWRVDEQAISLWRVDGGLRVLIVPPDAWVGRPR